MPLTRVRRNNYWHIIYILNQIFNSSRLNSLLCGYWIEFMKMNIPQIPSCKSYVTFKVTTSESPSSRLRAYSFSTTSYFNSQHSPYNSDVFLIYLCMYVLMCFQYPPPHTRIKAENLSALSRNISLACRRPVDIFREWFLDWRNGPINRHYERIKQLLGIVTDLGKLQM